MRHHAIRLVAALLLFLCPSALPAQASPPITFDPPEWNYGMILKGTVAQATVTVTNREAVPVEVTFVPTCTCLQVQPASQALPPHGRGTVHLSFDSIDDVGITTRGYIVRTDLPGAQPLYYTLRGVVREESAAAPAAAPAAPAGTGPGAGRAAAAAAIVSLDYYYTPGCRSCEEFLSVTLPRMAAARHLSVDVRRRDVLQPAVYEELSRLADAAGRPLGAVPALRIGGTLLQGDSEILKALPGLLAAAAVERGGARPPAQAASPGAAASTAVRVAVLPVLAAGLLDGINPCAFTTLIFLLASLALAGRGRTQVLLVGGLFTLAVFVTYLLVGLGFFSALRAAGAVPLLSVILRWVLVAALVVFAALSFYDYTLVRRGRTSEMLLQLPSFLKKRIHTSIRVRVRGGAAVGGAAVGAAAVGAVAVGAAAVGAVAVGAAAVPAGAPEAPAATAGPDAVLSRVFRAAALAGSSLVLGFLVSIFEFACTGQVYLPTLAYLARMQGRVDALGLLALYNVAFIVPLLVVFAASYAGTGQARIVALFQAHVGKVKIGLAVVFAALAVVTLVG